jgi:hypothetical protein
VVGGEGGLMREPGGRRVMVKPSKARMRCPQEEVLGHPGTACQLASGARARSENLQQALRAERRGADAHRDQRLPVFLSVPQFPQV